MPDLKPENNPSAVNSRTTCEQSFIPDCLTGSVESTVSVKAQGGSSQAHIHPVKKYWGVSEGRIYGGKQEEDCK